MTKNMNYVFLVLSIVFPALLKADSLMSIDIQSWGYKASNIQKYNESTCLFGFSPLQTIYRPIQSTVFSKEISQARYRFTLIKEVYASKDKAIKRIEYLNDPPLSNSLISKSCNIRKAFQLENSIFIVHTDVGAFTQEMGRVYRLYSSGVRDN